MTEQPLDKLTDKPHKKPHSWRKIILIVCAVVFMLGCLALALGSLYLLHIMSSEYAQVVDHRLDKEDDHHLNVQAKATVATVSDILERFPPQLPERLERRMALTMLDLIVHELYAPERPAIQDFIKVRIQRAVAEIEEAKITKGARIWKLYNHGFVVRTPSVTLAFDLVHSTGSRNTSLDTAIMARLAAQCDVLFVSHFHGDHADGQVAQLFIEAGKPVVVPPKLWDDMPVTCLERKAHELQTLTLKQPARELKVVVYPGHQDELTVPNNVVLVVTPEGMGIAHMGDQFMPFKDFDWIDDVAKHHRVDVLMPNCWTFNPPRVVKGFKPKLVITGHENELKHPVYQREPYWRSYDKLQKCSVPSLVMTWGESFHYLP